MNRLILDHQILNAKHCIEFLENLSKDEKSTFQRNRLTNHALAIYTLIQSAEALNNSISEIITENKELKVKISNLENEIVQPYVNNHLSNLKNELIEMITEYPKY